MRPTALATVAFVVALAFGPHVRADDAKSPDLAARCDAIQWTDPKPEWRDFIPPEARAIAKELTKRGSAAIPEIADALPKSVNLRRLAPVALCEWPCDRTRALLLAQLADKDELAAHHAAWALGVVGGAEVVQPLIDAASRQDSLVREQVLFALPQLGAVDRACDLVVASVADSRHWIRRVAAIDLEHVTRADRVDAAIAAAEKRLAAEDKQPVKDALARSLRVLRARK